MYKKILSIFALIPLLTSCNQNQSEYDFNLEKENSIGTLTLYAFNGDSERVPGTINLGHAFISVENTSDNQIKVGAMTLESNEQTSVGGWGQTAHFGIWYNIESTYMALGRYKGILSLTTQITEDDLTNLNSYIKEHDQWSMFKNCSFMALDMFNIVANENSKIKITGLITPGKIYNVLNKTDKNELERPIENFTKIGYSADYEMTSLVEYKLR